MAGVTLQRRARALAAPALIVAALGLSACDSGTSLGEPEAEPQTLTVSATYRQSEPDLAAERVDALTAAIADLRDATSSGWVGRQDDLTGYLGELSGGRFRPDEGGDDAAVITAFLDEYGGELLGIGSADLVLGDPSAPTIADVVSVRATQEIGGVPVLDGVLVFNLEVSDSDTRLNAVRGRAFADLSPATKPTIPAAQAARLAARASGGGTPQGAPELTVLAIGDGRLAWAVSVSALGAGSSQVNVGATYYVDAQSGAVIEVRANSAELETMVPLSQRAPGSPGLVVPTRVAVEGDPVAVSGTSRAMGELNATGLRLPDGGFALIDTTTPTYDPATTQGGIETYDMAGLPQSSLPGTLVTDPSPQMRNGEAVAAHALSRTIYDYYAALGRRSWDDQGSALVSSVNLGDSDFCNAFFDDSLARPQMVYGVPCGGLEEFVEIDVAAHEITHGVTDSSANLIYSGQPGALNEAFSDYFGNVIGNAYTQRDDQALGELGCARLTEPQYLCDSEPNGALAVRDLLSGNTYADYYYLLNTGYRYRVLAGDNNDNGGVHSNSLIWTNALWSIRTRLAQIDGVSGNESPLATDFDKIVYAALTTQLGPTSGFLDARAAVEQTIQAADADPTIMRVARELFDENKLCAGCTEPSNALGQVIVSSPQTQLGPTVSGDDVAWVDLSGEGALTGFAASSKVGGEPTNRTPDAMQVGFAGDSLVSLELPDINGAGEIAFYNSDGERTVMGRFGDAVLTVGLAGSDAGAAWSDATEDTATFVSPAGETSVLQLQPAGISSVTSIATGDGEVAIGTDSGLVYRWSPGDGSVTQLGDLEGAIFSLAASDGRVLALDDTQAAVLYDGAGAATVLSDSAVPYGAALNGDYAVWPESVGRLGGGVAEDRGDGTVDTDLHLYSMETGVIYNLLEERGQQGFPAISGDRLVWQDAVFGGDDIMTAELPPGL